MWAYRTTHYVVLSCRQVKVAQEATWVGLGWNLLAGGVRQP